MTEIVLEYQSSEPVDFEITIDEQPVNFETIGNQIIVKTEIANGFHMAKISATVNHDVLFTGASVNGTSLDGLFLLTYALDGKRKYQSQTITSTQNQLYLPFGNPVGWWYGAVTEKLPHELLSGGLYEDFEVYYPESITIPTTYPQNVQEFFKTNTDFYAIHRSELDDPYYNKRVPYCAVAHDIDYNEQELYDEFMTNLDFILGNLEEHQKESYLINAIVPSVKPYSLDDRFLLDKTQFPKLYQLLDGLAIGDILVAFVGIISPGKYITQHMDHYYQNKHVKSDTFYKKSTDVEEAFARLFDKYSGCSQTYIPINFKPGNLMKFYRVGLVPTDKPLVINNHNFVHGLINDSDEYRFAIAICGTGLK